MGTHVLFVDDDEAYRRTLVRGLKRLQSLTFQILEASGGKEAIGLAGQYSPSVAVIDLSLNPEEGPESGLKLMSSLILNDPTIRILALTGHGASAFGVQAIQHGAGSYLTKPVEPEHLLALIFDALSYSDLRRQLIAKSDEDQILANRLGIFTQAPKMKTALNTALFAASTPQPLLITGETGTGKGVLAKAIHQAGTRRRGRFLRLQPNFSNHEMLSSELFGHSRGAFTGALSNRTGLIEEAANGTLFIDEVGELPKETQIILLDVLQEGSFRRLGENKERSSDFRLITATNIPRTSLVSENYLRQDFYHRIAHLLIELPPLRERMEDLPQLSQHFIQEIANRNNLSVNDISTQAMAKLNAYDWPGNIRELQAVIESATYQATYKEKQLIDIEDIFISESKEDRDNTFSSDMGFRELITSYEKKLIQEALEKSKGNQSKAAKLLKMDRSSFRRILTRHQLPLKD